MRGPFQGVWNIIRFNWHFYVLSIGLILIVLLSRSYFPPVFLNAANVFIVLLTGLILISLSVSAYVYDFSNLYSLNWLNNVNNIKQEKIVNIHAGFDETSNLLKNKFVNAEISVLDFYDPSRHTEASIKRARKAYPPFPGTRQVRTNGLPLGDSSADLIFAILSIHEIRNENERRTLFIELRRILTPSGQIFVTEHLRDAANCLAYNVGAFHFYSKSTWLKTFKSSGLQVSDEIKITPFISTFILIKNGTST